MSDHVVSLRTYIAVFVSLLIGTALTVVAASVDMGWMNTPIALAIAVVKATLVILFFMHVKYSSRLTQVIIAASLFWLAIMLTFTLSDYFFRGHDLVMAPR
jgi:cytochrome c oxidase subunit 4